MKMYGVVLKIDLDNGSFQSLQSLDVCKKKAIRNFESVFLDWKEYRKYWKCVRLNVELDNKPTQTNNNAPPVDDKSK